MFQIEQTRWRVASDYDAAEIVVTDELIYFHTHTHNICFVLAVELSV